MEPDCWPGIDPLLSGGLQNWINTFCCRPRIFGIPRVFVVLIVRRRPATALSVRSAEHARVGSSAVWRPALGGIMADHPAYRIDVAHPRSRSCWLAHATARGTANQPAWNQGGRSARGGQTWSCEAFTRQASAAPAAYWWRRSGCTIW